jgi:hypothetical protein
VIAILAKAGDAAAETLASRWGSEARLMTPRDLARRGWVHRPGSDADVVVIDSGQVAARELTGVVTQLCFVAPDDLAPIVAVDRPYVAAEMTAFLLAWLSDLPCPVVNRPSPLGLAGPNLRPEAWMALASEAGIPVRPIRRDRHGYRAQDASGARDEVTVVGNRALGAMSARAGERALRLARRVDAEMMVAVFDPAEPDEPLLDAHTWPDLTRADVADALLELLTGRAGSPP